MEHYLDPLRFSHHMVASYNAICVYGLGILFACLKSPIRAFAIGWTLLGVETSVQLLVPYLPCERLYGPIVVIPGMILLLAAGLTYLYYPRLQREVEQVKAGGTVQGNPVL